MNMMIPCGQNFPPLEDSFPRQWRYLPPISAPGWVQMGIDHWLLEQHRQGHPPSLRFYTWSPAAISLGYHQRSWPDHWQQLTWQGQALDLVRRPTGGRAVLHQGDLTYALVFSGLRGERHQIYAYLGEFLRQGMATLGIRLSYGQRHRGPIHQPSCFATATGADWVLENGDKLIGSAQVWRQGSVLQHGSIRLDPNPRLELEVFGAETWKAPKIRLPTPAELIPTLEQAAQTWFQVECFTQPLNAAEWQQILTVADQFAVTSGGSEAASRTADWAIAANWNPEG
jgi:lipoate---protein ligase